MRRVFLLVLDSVGCGEMPDSARYGDENSHTLRAVCQTGQLSVPTLCRLGLGHIEGLSFLKTADSPLASYGRCAEASVGKDTTTGHWEIAGLISRRGMPTFPDGFPPEVLALVREVTGKDALCGLPYSGTKVIVDYGREHEATGRPIVYTSADSVLQIAAHTSVVPLATLYRWCEDLRARLTGPYGVGRVIARPIEGVCPDYRRTADRRDFSLPPPEKTLCDYLSEAGKDVIGVGKIGDIFAMHGITCTYPAHGNAECMNVTKSLLENHFNGLCFVNLVDFDMLYGHRNDAVGYARALSVFDEWLTDFLPCLHEEDALLLTADHGCDPSTPSTDHSREYVPLLLYGKTLPPKPLGTRTTYADIGATVASLLGVATYRGAGTSFF